ncbi:hypothetical protein [Bacillus thuringiensis]
MKKTFFSIYLVLGLGIINAQDLNQTSKCSVESNYTFNGMIDPGVTP